MSRNVVLLSDLDGVLLDSKGSLLTTYLQVCQDEDLPALPEAFVGLLGKTLESIFSDLYPNMATDGACLRFRDYSSRQADGPIAFDGSRSFINSLRSLTPNVGYLTSKDKQRAKQALRRLGFPELPIFSPSAHFRPKPYPDLFHEADNFFGANCGQMYFGDTTWDREAAHNAGAKFVFCRWGYGDLPTDSSLASALDFEDAYVHALSFVRG